MAKRVFYQVIDEAIARSLREFPLLRDAKAWRLKYLAKRKRRKPEDVSIVKYIDHGRYNEPFEMKEVKL